MTLVQFIVNFLRPYADMPEFTTCVMKALEELGHRVNTESMYQKPAKSCRLAGKEAHTVIVDDTVLQQDMWDNCDE